MSSKLTKIKIDDYKPLRDVIFNTLRDAIIKGELKPGERLMEVHLAEKMGVSRTPVREAIRKLELEGLVDMIPRKGTHVAQLSTKDIIDVLEVRAALDRLATELAAERLSYEAQGKLESILKQFTNFVEKQNTQGAIKKDVEFHDEIYKAAGNSKLFTSASTLREQFQRYRVIYLKDYETYNEVIREHNEIFSALIKKNKELAGNMAVKHIKSQQQAIITKMQKINS